MNTGVSAALYSGRSQGHKAYSLIEVLIALVVLLLMIQALGSSLVTVMLVERKAIRMGELTRVGQDLVTDCMLGHPVEDIVEAWPHEEWRLEFEPFDPKGTDPSGLKQDRWIISARDGLEPVLELYLASADS